MARRYRKINCEIEKDLNNSEAATRMKVKPKVNQEIVFGGTGYNNKVNNALKKKQQKLPDIRQLESEILQYIIGQDEQVRQIITAIYRAKMFTSIKSNILIIGNSGTGKTATIEQIAKRLNLAYTIEDATKYTQEGYYGGDVEEMVYNLLENANGDVEKAQRGLIIIDEIDKKAGNDGIEGFKVEVMKSLLKIIEGTTIRIQDITNPLEPINFDTRNIVIIFMGAFEGLGKIRDKRLNTKTLGFKVSSKEETKNPKEGFVKEDLKEYGMPEEFVGRIDTIIQMNQLTKRDLEVILRKSRLSIFKCYQKELKKMGITLSYKVELLEKIAEKSMNIGTGARELSNTVNYIFEKIIYDIFSNPNKYKQCTLSLDIVEDNTKYKLS